MVAPGGLAGSHDRLLGQGPDNGTTCVRLWHVGARPPQGPPDTSPQASIKTTWGCISLNCQMYLSKLPTLFIKIAKYICLNYPPDTKPRKHQKNLGKGLLWKSGVLHLMIQCAALNYTM